MPKAVFQTIHLDLKNKIENGTYPYQSYLPSETELTRIYDCSRSSVRRALADLAAEGYVQSQQGKGVRVIRNPRVYDPSSFNSLETFNELSARMGWTPLTRVLTFEEIVADEEIARTTGFSVGSSVTHILRSRAADGVVISTDESYYLSEKVPGLSPEIVEDSVYAYLEGTLGIKVGTSKRIITVEAVTDVDREILDLGGFNAVGVLRSHTFDTTGIMIEYTETHQVPERFSSYELSIRRQAGR